MGRREIQQHAVAWLPHTVRHARVERHQLLQPLVDQLAPLALHVGSPEAEQLHYHNRRRRLIIARALRRGIAGESLQRGPVDQRAAGTGATSESCQERWHAQRRACAGSGGCRPWHAVAQGVHRQVLGTRLSPRAPDSYRQTVTEHATRLDMDGRRRAAVSELQGRIARS